MNFRFLFSVLFSFSVSVFITSCEADIDLSNISTDISLHPELIIPIGGASVTLGQIILKNDSTGRFQVGEDSEINYTRVDTSEFKFPAINFLMNSLDLKKNYNLSPYNVLTFPANTLLPAISEDEYISLGINASKNGDRIDSILVKSATISVKIDISPDLGSINPKDLNFTIEFPNGRIRKLDKSSSTISFSPGRFGAAENFVIKDFMMSTAGGETGIPIRVKIDAKSGVSPLFLSPGSIISSTIKFTQLDYVVAYGNLKSNFSLPNFYEQHIDIDDDLPNGLLKFANPQVRISATSNIGTYLNFQIDYVKAYQSSNTDFNSIFASFNGSRSTNISLKDKPVIPGKTVEFELPTLDKDWGGTNHLFDFDDETMPDMLQYKFSASVDSVLNSQSKTPSFITSDAKIKVVLKTIIPLSFSKGSYYEYQDSIKNLFVLIANALNQTPYNNISSTALVMNVTNGLPVNTTFTFEMTDSIGHPILTDFEKKYIIKAGSVDLNGIVQPGKETKQTIVATVTKDQLVILKKAKAIVYKIRIDGNDVNSNIHFTKFNTFDVKAGLFIKGDINANLSPNTQK